MTAQPPVPPVPPAGGPRPQPHIPPAPPAQSGFGNPAGPSYGEAQAPGYPHDGQTQIQPPYQPGGQPPMPPTPPYGGPIPGAQPPFPPVKRSNWAAIVALVCGILAFMSCWIPVVNVVAVLLGLVAIGFGIAGIRMARNRGSGLGLGITGLGLGAVALLAAILINVWAFTLAKRPDPSASPIPTASASRKASVRPTPLASYTPRATTTPRATQASLRPATSREAMGTDVSFVSADKTLNLTMQVKQVVEGQKVAQREGKLAVGAEVLINNVGDKPVDMKNFSLVYVVTASGKNYAPMVLGKLEGKETLDVALPKMLAPGAQAAGWLAFDVPAGEKPAYLQFTDVAWDIK